MALHIITTNVQHKEMWEMLTKTYIAKAESKLAAAVAKAAGCETSTGTSPDMAFVRSLSEDPAVTEHMKENMMEIIGRVIERSPAEASQAIKIVKTAKCSKKDFTKIKSPKIGKSPAGGVKTSIRKHIG